jgi:hypothetical protein
LDEAYTADLFSQISPAAGSEDVSQTITKIKGKKADQ